MKKIKVVVVGNCQARPIAALLEKMSDQIEVTKVAIVHLLKNEQEEEYNHFFEEADYIIAQLVAPNYPCEFVRNSFLKEYYGTKIVTIVNLFFLGYTPDWRYIRIPGKGTLKGPMGDYHNKTIVESWRKGLSPSETCELLSDVEYNANKYGDLVKESLFELKSREANADVAISDYIHSEMLNKRLFFTFNHPTIELLQEYCKRILETLALEVNIIEPLNGEPLDPIIPILNCGVGFNLPVDKEHKGFEVQLADNSILLGKSKRYAPIDLISVFYQIYSANSELILSMK